MRVQQKTLKTYSSQTLGIRGSPVKPLICGDLLREALNIYTCHICISYSKARRQLSIPFLLFKAILSPYIFITVGVRSYVHLLL